MARFLWLVIVLGLSLQARAQDAGINNGGGGGGTPGGTSGQTQYNNGGALGGYTPGGDCTVDPSTGLTTCLKLNGVSPGVLFSAGLGPNFVVDGSNNLQSTVLPLDCTSGTCPSQAAGVIPSSAQGQRVLLGAHSYTLAQDGTAGFTAGWGPWSIVSSAGPSTITATTSTFAPASATNVLVLQTGDEAYPTSLGTGTQYYTTLARTSALSATQASQTISGGATVTTLDNGTKSSGTFTPDCGLRPVQKYTNGGAHTLAAPTSGDGSCVLDMINNGSAGAVTLSGFSPNTMGGATLDTTNGHKFRLYVSCAEAGTCTVDAKALQ